MQSVGSIKCWPRCWLMGGPGQLARSDTNKRNFACFVLAIAKLTGVGKFQPLAACPALRIRRIGHGCSAQYQCQCQLKDTTLNIRKRKKNGNKVRKPDCACGWSEGTRTGNWELGTEDWRLGWNPKSRLQRRQPPLLTAWLLFWHV